MRWAASFLLLLCVLALPAQSPAQTITYIPSGDTAALQSAINAVAAGGIIELAAGPYEITSTISISGRPRFTIRAAPGATVTLSGGGARRIMNVTNGAAPVTFERLTFSQGVDSTIGGVLVADSRATFVGCVFQNNGSASSTGAGGVYVLRSTVFFTSSVWTDNSSKNFGAAMVISGGGTSIGAVYIHDSRFVNNRANLPGHLNISPGGAIHMNGGKLRVTNTRFEANQAGYTGGALYVIAPFTDGVTSDVVIANSTFVDNQAINDLSVPAVAPSVGGAIHFEDDTTAKLYNSRFVTNRARQGGAISSYRAVVEINDSVFQGNQATTATSTQAHGLGGAIIALSADNPPSGTNRRAMQLTVSDTLFQGRFGSVTTTGRQGGCLFLGGDSARNWGSAEDHTVDNHAAVDLNRVVFANCDVAGDANFPGAGGALLGTLLDLTVTDSLIINSDSTGGAYASGGGFQLQLGSSATFSGTTFARNSAAQEGGALWVEGGTLNVSACNLVENTAPSGSLGAALRTGPSAANGDVPAIAMTGLVDSSKISNNSGVGFIEESDGTGSPPFNTMQYTSNKIFDPNGNAFYNPNGGLRSVAQLDSLNLHGVQKGSGNTPPPSAPVVVGAILAVPPQKLPRNASLDPAPPTASYLGYAWSGGSATLDGQARSGSAGLEEGNTGAHTLSVASTPFTATINDGPLPDTVLIANPDEIASGGSTSLQWTTLDGSFLEEAIDQGVNLPLSLVPNGSVSVSANSSRTYRGFLVAKEGGDVDTAILDITNANDRIFRDGFDP